MATDLLAWAADVAASADFGTISSALARAAHELFSADAEVSIVRGEEQLGQARVGDGGTTPAAGTELRVERRVAATGLVVELLVRGVPHDATLDPTKDAVTSLVAVAAATASKIAAIADARSLARERQEIVAIVSHDLRTPLQSLGLGLDALGMLIAGSPVATPCASTLARMQRAIAAMGRLLSDLLDVSRIHDGALSLHMKPCDVGRLFSELAEQHAPLAAARGFAFEASPGAVGEVVCDAGRLTQALSNLVSNAIRHASSGPIVLRAVRTEQGVRFEVEDRGPGIPGSVRARLFDRLYQAPDDGGRRGGLGLGLYIAKGIAVAHGGAIGVDSELGRGSTFWIEIASRRQSVAPAHTSDPPAS